MKDRTIYKLDDSVLAQIVKLLQLAMVTQTDITDHMRVIHLEPSREKNGMLVLTPEYKEKDQNDIERLLNAALEAQRSEPGAN